MKTHRYKKCSFFASVALTLAALLSLPSCVWKTGTMIEDGGKTHWDAAGKAWGPLWTDDKGRYYAEMDVMKCRWHHREPWNLILPYAEETGKSVPLAGEKARHCWVELKPVAPDCLTVMAIAALLPEKPAHCVKLRNQTVSVTPSDGRFTNLSATWRVPLAWCSRVAVDAPLTIINVGGSVAFIVAATPPVLLYAALVEQPQKQENPGQAQSEQIAEKSRGAETKK